MKVEISSETVDLFKCICIFIVLVVLTVPFVKLLVFLGGP